MLQSSSVLESYGELRELHGLIDQGEKWLGGHLGVPLCVENCGRCCMANTPTVHSIEASYIISYLMGAGKLNIIDWCTENANPRPSWHEGAGSVYVTFLPAVLPTVQRGAEKVATKSPSDRSEVTPQVATEVTMEVTTEVRLLRALVGEMSRQALRQALGLKNDEHFRKTYLLPALEAGLIEMTIPDKPRSSKQRYRLTDKGERLSIKDTSTKRGAR
jgi:hypothetical protein